MISRALDNQNDVCSSFPWMEEHAPTSGMVDMYYSAEILLVRSKQMKRRQECLQIMDFWMHVSEVRLDLWPAD